MELPTSFQVRRAKFGTRRPGARCASSWASPFCDGPLLKSSAHPLNAGDTLHGTWQRCPPPLADSRSPCCLSSFFYSAHVHRGRRLLLHMHKLVTGCRCLYSSVAERQSCKLKVLGSIPSGGSGCLPFTPARWHWQSSSRETHRQPLGAMLLQLQVSSAGLPTPAAADLGRAGAGQPALHLLRGAWRHFSRQRFGQEGSAAPAAGCWCPVGRRQQWLQQD